jgi:hypothetical protein
MELLGIEVTFEEFDRLMSEQSQGKQLKVVDGKIVAVEYKQTEEELLNIELKEINLWFTWYDNQVAQYNRSQRLGIEFDRDINELDNEATQKQLRIREIQDKLKTEV